MKNENLLLDSTNNKTYKYFSECLNLFIPEFLNHTMYSYNGTQNVGMKQITDTYGNRYLLWQPHFNKKTPNRSGFINEINEDYSVIHEINVNENIKYADDESSPRLVFANFTDGNGYKFLGLYSMEEKSNPNDRWYVRVANKVDFSCNPPIFYFLNDNYLKKEISKIKSIEKNLLQNKELDRTERETLVKNRIGQGAFRNQLICKYSECVICGISNTKLLRASHIKDWSKSKNKERTNINNGLLFCAQHDCLFDADLISFNEKGEIMISKQLSEKDRKILKLNNNIKIELNDEMRRFMKDHNDDIMNNSRIVKHNKYGIGRIVEQRKRIIIAIFGNKKEIHFSEKELKNGTIKRIF